MNRGIDGFFEDLRTSRSETDTKALPQYLERRGLRTEIETWLDSQTGKKMADKTKDFRRDYHNDSYDSLHVFPVTAALLLHRFDMLAKLQDLGCQMFRPNMLRGKDQIGQEGKCSFSKNGPQYIDSYKVYNENDVENADMLLILITNLKRLKAYEVREIQEAAKRDFECMSEEQRELVCEDIVHAFSMSESNNIRFCWSRIKKYHPWLADAILKREYSSMITYPFIKDWLESNRGDQSRQERISKLIGDAGQWDIFREASPDIFTGTAYEYDEYFDAVKFAEEYVQQDAENEAGLFSEFVEYVITNTDIEERRKYCLYAEIKEMSERHTDILIKKISKNAFRTDINPFRVGYSFDREETFRYLVGLLHGESINIKYLGNAELRRYSEFPERFEYQQKIFRILPLDPGNRKRLYAFHKALIHLDSEEVLTDAIGRGLFGRGNLREAVEYAENIKCYSVLPILITEEHRAAAGKIELIREKGFK